jgi:hypothetical protein
MGRGNAIFGLLLSSGFRKIEGCSNESSIRKQKRNGNTFILTLTEWLKEEGALKT